MTGKFKTGSGGEFHPGRPLLGAVVGFPVKANLYSAGPCSPVEGEIELFAGKPECLTRNLHVEGYVGGYINLKIAFLVLIVLGYEHLRLVNNYHIAVAELGNFNVLALAAFIDKAHNGFTAVARKHGCIDLDFTVNCAYAVGRSNYHPGFVGIGYPFALRLQVDCFTAAFRTHRDFSLVYAKLHRNFLAHTR